MEIWGTESGWSDGIETALGGKNDVGRLTWLGSQPVESKEIEMRGIIISHIYIYICATHGYIMLHSCFRAVSCDILPLVSNYTFRFKFDSLLAEVLPRISPRSA